MAKPQAVLPVCSMSARIFIAGFSPMRPTGARPLSRVRLGQPVVVMPTVELRGVLVARSAGPRPVGEPLEVALAGRTRSEMQEHRGRLAGFVPEPVDSADRDV